MASWEASGQALQRSPALDVLVSDEAAIVSIAPLQPSTRFSLRLRASALRDLDPSHDIQLDIPINTCRETGGRTVTRLGPDEWWLLCPDPMGAAFRQDLQRLLHSHLASVVDISHRQSTIAIAGMYARDIINTGCPLDLHDASFPLGTATRTLLGKAEIVLTRSCADRCYHLEFLRSFATYVHTFLTEAAREFIGLTPPGRN